MRNKLSINTRGADLSDMIGKQYGGVIVENIIEPHDGRRGRFLVCRCAYCGAPATMRRAGELLSHPPKGCFACTMEMQRDNSDLSGAEYPAFTVVERVGEPLGIKTLWRCICKVCGAECIMQQKKLREYVSCGCLADKAREAGRDLVKSAAVDGTSLLAIQPDRKLNKNSSTGVRGVTKDRNGRYRAYINLRRRQKYLGTYDTLEEAAEARAEAERLMYSPILDENR